MRRAIRRMIAVGLGATTVLWPTAISAHSAPVARGGTLASEHLVPIMTQNMDEATGFGPVLAATSLSEFETAVSATYQEVQASMPDERAAAVAHEIARTRPILVGLQEASLWRTGPSTFPPTPATTVQFDQLDSLVSALTSLGLHYTPVRVQANLDVQGPSSLGFDVRVTDRNVVLARTDLPLTQFELTHVDSAVFTASLNVPSAVLGRTVSVPRSWIAVDARVGGTRFRFITTHLEASSPPVQVAQANELLEGPANVGVPTVISGDFNSAASGGPDPSTTYTNLVAPRTGFRDAWTRLHPHESGFTWPLHGEDPYTFVLPPPLSERIDLILVSRQIHVVGIERQGFTARALTPNRLWPSDHAGVTAELLIHGARATAQHNDAFV